MVSLSAIEASNASIASSIPNLVAVFVGSTSGVGETAMKQFAKHAKQPRIYFIGRSQKEADRITAECKVLNQEGSYTFMQVDTSLLKNVDEACKELKSKEKAINLLVMSSGTLQNMGKDTPEGLHYPLAVTYYGRTRFVANLLPELQAATSLRRVVSVFCGTKEGAIDTSDIAGYKTINPIKSRGHLSSMTTLALEALAKQAPTVSFVHDFPGVVKGNLIRGGEGVALQIAKWIFKAFGPLMTMPYSEAGDRHTYFATSAKYPALQPDGASQGCLLSQGVEVAVGTDGKTGSGVYTISEDGESGVPEVVKVLAGLRKAKVDEMVWEHTEKEFKRVTGVLAI